MRGVSKKMFISILTSVIVFVTMVATTFAWVGIFTYANTEYFQMNLKVEDYKTNYFLTISDSGEKGTYSDSIPLINIERQILNKRYNNKYLNASDQVITKVFSSSPISNVSTFVDETANDLTQFYKLDTSNRYRPDFVETNSYIDFDIYLSVDTKEGITSDTTGIKANVVIDNITNCLEGVKMYYRFLNHNPFSGLPSGSEYSILKTIHDTKTFNINTKNSARFSLTLYEPIPIDEEYTNQLAVKTVVFQGGKQKPEYSSADDIYDLGGILPNDYNTASKELLAARSSYEYSNEFFNKLDEVINNRNDLELVEENRLIWDKDQHDNDYLGCMNGIQTKMKVNVRLWFEGWDSDCISALEEKSITLNLAFTANNDF